MENSIVIMLAWVVNLMCKSSTPYNVGLLYNDNLIKCEAIFYLKEILINTKYQYISIFAFIVFN